MRISFFIYVIIGIIAIGGAALFFFGHKTLNQTPKVYRIAIITRKDVTAYEEAITSYREKMRELGYTEGQNVFYDIRRFGNSTQLKQIMRDVIAAHADLIATYSTPATVEAYQQTKGLPYPIPVVFGSVGDPLAAGVVQDIGRPGTNVTGVVSLATELTADRLRFLKEINPLIKRIAMPHSADTIHDIAANRSVEIAKQNAKRLNVDLMLLPVSSQEENARVAKSITGKNAQGMIAGGDSLIWGSIEAYITQAIKEKIPFAAFDLTQIAKGALIGIGPDYTHVGKQAAALTHQILRGASPAIIAVQVPDKLILAVNLTTARAIGITLNDALVKRADVIIGK